MPVVKTCERCGKDFTRPPSMAATRFCSWTCRKTPPRPPCERCGKDYNDKKGNGRFCSRACLFDSIRGTQRKSPNVRACVRCGSEFTSKAKEFCGWECYVASKTGVPIKPRPASKVCECCGDEFDNTRNGRFCGRVCSNKGRNPKKPKQCDQCGAEYPGQSVSRFCSKKCYGVWRSANIFGERCPTYSGGPIKSKARRYARIKTSSVGEKIDRHAIYERDGGECYICGRPVPFEKFTLDHVIPPGPPYGGVHGPSNLRVACKSCNCRKQDKPLSEFVCFLYERPAMAA